MGRQELNDRQEAFVREYLRDFNATQAAIRAGYAERGAHVQGCRLLSNPKIKHRLAAIEREAQQQAKVDAAWLLERLVQMVEVDLSEIFDSVGNLKSIDEMSEGARRILGGLEITRQPGSGAIITKIKVMDRVRILELIGKHIEIGAFHENIALIDEHDLVNKILAARKREREARDRDDTIH